MVDVKIEARAHDLEEEQHAAARIKAQLADKPIIGTSGNEEHRLTPVDVKVRVGLTDEGQELKFEIKHQDRHHPELVRKTIEAELAKLPELAGLTPKPLDAKRDYKQDGEMVIRYAASGDNADNIIHALSHAHHDGVPLPQSAPTSEVAQPVTVAISPEAANDANMADWVTKTTIAKTIERFTGRA